MSTLSIDTCRVVIADDQFDMRMLMRLYLGSDPAIEIVGEAEDGEAALQLWHELGPERVDTMILDQMMPYRTGLEVAAAIREEDNEVRIVLFSAAMDSTMAASCELVGVTAAIRKTDLRDLPANAALAPRGRAA